MSLTYIEINRRNLLHNLRQFKNIAPQSALWPVIKSNAYGHGFAEIISIINESQDVAGLAVVNLAEAFLAKNLSPLPVMVLSYFDEDDELLARAIGDGIILPIYSQESYQIIIKIAEKIGKRAAVNIKIDTGTHRLGFMAGDDALVTDLVANKNLEVVSFFTHFAESEAENLNFTKEQQKEFDQIIKKWPQIKKHSACSAATISYPESRSDIIRLGLGLYGLWPSYAAQKRGEAQGMSLKPVLSLKSKIIQIKKIKAGESIGYNRTFIAQEDMEIAVLPIGYYEGWPRQLSNVGQVLLAGQRCPVRGNICMNLTMIELGKNQTAKVGDEVVLIGQDGHESMSAEEVASKAQTISYEIIARLNSSLKRIII